MSAEDLLTSCLKLQGEIPPGSTSFLVPSAYRKTLRSRICNAQVLARARRSLAVGGGVLCSTGTEARIGAGNVGAMTDPWHSFRSA